MSQSVGLFNVMNRDGEIRVLSGIPTIRGQLRPVLAYVYPIVNPELLGDLQESSYCENVLVTAGNIADGKLSLLKELLCEAEKAIVWVQLIKTAFFSSKLIIGKGITVSYSGENEIATNTIIEIPAGSSFSIETSYEEELERPNQVCNYIFDGKNIIAQ